MYIGLPILISLKGYVALIANPKSAILQDPFDVRKIFATLKSLCIMERLFKYKKPW